MNYMICNYGIQRINGDGNRSPYGALKYRLTIKMLQTGRSDGANNTLKSQRDDLFVIKHEWCGN